MQLDASALWPDVPTRQPARLELTYDSENHAFSFEQGDLAGRYASWKTPLDYYDYRQSIMTGLLEQGSGRVRTTLQSCAAVDVGTSTVLSNILICA